MYKLNLSGDKSMVKYILPLVMMLSLSQVGCKDEDQSLPEQGHNGPTIDVQNDMKKSPSVHNIQEEQIESKNNYNIMQSASSMSQSSHDIPEGPVIPIQSEKQEKNK